MINKKDLMTNIIQIYSLIIKDLKLKIRYKSEFIMEFIAPIMTMFFPFIIFSTLFDLNENAFGTYFSRQNYVLFLLLGYIVNCLIFLLWNYKDLFYDEKTWKTINAVMVAPVKKINILLGYFISGLISKSPPIIIIIILCYTFYPISLLYLIFVIIILFCIAITFAGIGFILGLFEIVNEDISATLAVGITFISLLSCLFYPITIFPEYLHFILKANPLFYYFDLLRLSWWAGINQNEALSYITVSHFIFIGVFTVLTPICASIFFFRIFKKYGASGY